MYRAVLIAGFFASPLSPASTSPVAVPRAAIVQVVCFGKDMVTSGTAFRIGNGLLLSVNHVTSTPNCYIQGKPIDLKWKSPKEDFSMLGGDDGPFLTVDCGGFIKGRRYAAIGYARGLDTPAIVEMVATGDTEDGFAVLIGLVTVIPGQSGGPIIDETTGRVVGTVNAENFEEGLSFSVPLSATPICKRSVA